MWHRKPIPFSAEVKERVELYLYSPSWTFTAHSMVNLTQEYMFSQRTSFYTIRKNFKQFQLHTVLTFNIRASYNVDEEEKKSPICWTHMWERWRRLVWFKMVWLPTCDTSFFVRSMFDQAARVAMAWIMNITNTHYVKWVPFQTQSSNHSFLQTSYFSPQPFLQFTYTTEQTKQTFPVCVRVPQLWIKASQANLQRRNSWSQNQARYLNWLQTFTVRRRQGMKKLTFSHCNTRSEDPHTACM